MSLSESCFKLEAGVARVIVVNKARCKRCGDTIESKHRHDWRECGCGGVFVDGGRAYLRRGGDIELLDELSEFKEE